jgi:hypothetical protein
VPENKVKIETDSEDSDSEEERNASPIRQDEQKVRLEEKEGQKVALRPGPLTPGERPSSGSEGEGEEREKPGVSPDGASFQDVQL